MSSSLIMIDTNELRAAAFSAFFTPWAVQSDINIHVVHNPDDLAGLPVQTIVACLYSVGGMSLHDRGVIQTFENMRSLFPDCPIIVCSDRLDKVEIEAAIHLGLRGFLPTTMPSHVGLAAIQFILSGGTYHPHSSHDRRAGISSPSTSALIRHGDEPWPRRTVGRAFSSSACNSHREVSDPAASHQTYDGLALNAVLEPLTKRRHIEVLEYLAQGETNKEIARHLNLTEATIKVYVRELMRHFGAKNRMQVILKASTLLDADAPETATIGRLVEHSSFEACSNASG